MTLRCLREDLDLDLPSVEVNLGGLDHPLIAETRRLAPAAPRGQKRILSIEAPRVPPASWTLARRDLARNRSGASGSVPAPCARSEDA